MPFSIVTALEIITNPDDLYFCVSGKEFCIMRGPGHRYKALLSGKFNKNNGVDTADWIGNQLRNFVKTVEVELDNGGSFLGLLDLEDKTLEELNILKDDEIDAIVEGLKKDGKYQTF